MRIIETKSSCSHSPHALYHGVTPRASASRSTAEYQPQHWQALNHAIAVNDLLGYENRVAVTNRDTHAPTPESNAQLSAFFEFCLGTGIK